MTAECGSKCRSKQDAAKLISVIANLDCTEEEVLLYLTSAGICSNPGKVVDALGRSLLHAAASVGRKRVAEWLLRHRNASINAKDGENGFTPLMRALFYGGTTDNNVFVESYPHVRFIRDSRRSFSRGEWSQYGGR